MPQLLCDCLRLVKAGAYDRWVPEGAHPGMISRESACMQHPTGVCLARQELECFDFAAGANPETDEDGSFWDYQWCGTPAKAPSCLNRRINMPALLQPDTCKAHYMP